MSKKWDILKLAKAALSEVIEAFMLIYGFFGVFFCCYVLTPYFEGDAFASVQPMSAQIFVVISGLVGFIVAVFLPLIMGGKILRRLYDLPEAPYRLYPFEVTMTVMAGLLLLTWLGSIFAWTINPVLFVILGLLAYVSVESFAQLWLILAVVAAIGVVWNTWGIIIMFAAAYTGRHDDEQYGGE